MPRTLWPVVLAATVLVSLPVVGESIDPGSKAEVTAKTKLWPAEKGAQPTDVKPGDVVEVEKVTGETAYARLGEAGGWIKLKYLKPVPVVVAPETPPAASEEKTAEPVAEEPPAEPAAEGSSQVAEPAETVEPVIEVVAPDGTAEVEVQVLLFGGRGSDQYYLGGPWEWDGSSWALVNPADPEGDGNPSPRFYHSMTYDNARSKVVLFGGMDPGEKNDTWEWNHGSGARPGHVMQITFAESGAGDNCIIKEVSSSWRSGGVGFPGPACGAKNGSRLQVWDEGRWKPVATNVSDPDAPERLRWSTINQQQFNHLFFGPQQILGFAVTPTAANGCSSQYGEIATDYVEVTVRYRIGSECGDGEITDSETCDDGNTEDGDGCSSDCLVEDGICGDGVRNVGEDCDDGNTVDDGNGCDEICLNNAVCGDWNHQDLFEECDDGNTVSRDGCSSACKGDGSCRIAAEVTGNINLSRRIDSTWQASNSEASSCGATNSGEVVYVMTPETSETLVISTAHGGTDFDTVLSARTDCRDPATEIACNDDDIGEKSTISIDVTAGETYYILVEGAGTAAGTFEISFGLPESGDSDADTDADTDTDTDADLDCGVMSCNDPATKLTWKKTGSVILRSWQGAQDYCSLLDIDGYQDWRLPSIGELRSLIRGCAPTETGSDCDVDDDCSDGICEVAECTGCADGAGPADGCYRPRELFGPCRGLWSLSSVADDVQDAWGVDFTNGAIFRDLKDYDYSPLCVRKPLDCDADVCTDPVTGLSWQRVPSATTFSWQNAINYCSIETTGGFSDWRQPTVGELRTMINGCLSTQSAGACRVRDGCLDSNCHDAGCDGCAPTSGPASGCYRTGDFTGPCGEVWSASEVADQVIEGWLADFDTGQIFRELKSSYNLSWCVR